VGRSMQGGEQRERKKAERAGGGWLGTVGRQSESEVESKEKRVRSRAVVCGVRSRACFGGKWFTEIFSVNRFPFFPKRFTVK
jgi:hypothetical protein